jgi:hypothetical protein
MGSKLAKLALVLLAEYRRRTLAPGNGGGRGDDVRIVRQVRRCVYGIRVTEPSISAIK